jgi:hypothetical protein
MDGTFQMSAPLNPRFLIVSFPRSIVPSFFDQISFSDFIVKIEEKNQIWIPHPFLRGRFPKKG